MKAKPSLRRKSLSNLRGNISNLPYLIGCWRRSGQTEKADRGERILADCRAELARRNAA